MSNPDSERIIENMINLLAPESSFEGVGEDEELLTPEALDKIVRNCASSTKENNRKIYLNY